MPEAQAQTQTQTQTQVPAPVTVVKQRSFGNFAFTVILLIVAAVFCYVYFSTRRKRTAKHVDQKAGDEGED